MGDLISEDTDCVLQLHQLFLIAHLKAPSTRKGVRDELRAAKRVVDTPAQYLWNQRLQRPSQYSAWSLPSTTFCSHTAHFTGHRSIDPSSTRPAQALVLLGADFDAEAEFAGVGEVVVIAAAVGFVAVLPCFEFLATGVFSQQLFYQLSAVSS